MQCAEFSVMSCLHADWVNAIAASFSALFALISCGIFVYSLVYVRSQIREMKKSTGAAAFGKALDILQKEEARRDRGAVYLIDPDVPVDRWYANVSNAAERVCHGYDQVAIMIQAGMFEESLVLDNWGRSLRKCWPLLEPLVMDRRSKTQDDELWDDFERLAKKAIARKK